MIITPHHNYFIAKCSIWYTESIWDNIYHTYLKIGKISSPGGLTLIEFLPAKSISYITDGYDKIHIIAYHTKYKEKDQAADHIFKSIGLRLTSITQKIMFLKELCHALQLNTETIEEKESGFLFKKDLTHQSINHIV